MRVVIYVRVSSQEQVTGYSLDAQEDACRTWAADQGYEVVRVFIEPGRSARTDQRPVFQSMIQLVTAGIAGGIIIHKSDRIARNLLDLLTYRNRLEKAGVRLFSVLEPFFNDDSPESRMVVGIIGSINEFYSANLSREVKKGQQQAARSGRFPGGKLPRGYVRDEAKNIIHGPDADHISQAFFEFASGRYTLRDWAKRQGEHHQTWRKIFRNIFYTGQFMWNNQQFQGDHPPVVDASTFEAVQEILDSRDSGGSKKRHTWLLAGLLWSEVHNKTMSGSLAKGRFAYYVAKGSGGQHTIEAEGLEMRVISVLQNITGTSKRTKESWRLALSVSRCVGELWPFIEPAQQKELLRLVFQPGGIVVAAGGAVVAYRLNDGFEPKP